MSLIKARVPTEAGHAAHRNVDPCGEIYNLFRSSRFVAIGDDYLSPVAPEFVSRLLSRKESPITHLAIELPARMQQGSGLTITDSLINDVSRIYPGRNGAMASVLRSAQASGISAIFFHMRSAFEHDTDREARMAELIHSLSAGENARVLVYCGIPRAGLERKTRHHIMPIWKMSAAQPLISHLSRIEGKKVPSLILLTGAGYAAEAATPLLSVRRIEVTEKHPAGERKHTYSGAIYVPGASFLQHAKEDLQNLRQTQA